MVRPVFEIGLLVCQFVRLAIRQRMNAFFRKADGEEIVQARTYTERIPIGGRFVERTLTRGEKIEDNDLPIIAEKYHEFLKEQEK